jgi:hypothetical protein
MVSTDESLRVPKFLRDAFSGLVPIGNGLRAGVVAIDSAFAASILERCNKGNRNLRDRVISRYSRDMGDGNWRVNGEPIIFDVSGNLLNGQHRLSAVVRSDSIIECVVVFGVASDTMASIDQVASRTVGDSLGLLGESNKNVLAGAASSLWQYERGALNDGGATRPTQGARTCRASTRTTATRSTRTRTTSRTRRRA